MDMQKKFAENPDPKCICGIVIDASYSNVVDGRMDKINEGLVKLFEHLKTDHLANRRVELCIVEVSGDKATLVQPFITVADIINMQPPQFTAHGGTPMEHGLAIALSAMKEHKKLLKTNGIPLFKPMLFVLSDGEFNVSQNTRDDLIAYERENGYTMFALGVGADACPQSLVEISATGRGYVLDSAHIPELFQFISTSMTAVSHSQPGQKNAIALPKSIKVVQVDEVTL